MSGKLPGIIKASFQLSLLSCDSVFPCATEKCPQMGYPVPVAGNDLCPMLKEEEQCTSEVTETQLAEGAVRCDFVIRHVRY